METHAKEVTIEIDASIEILHREGKVIQSSQHV
jgi:hypothetical protein